MNEAWQIDSHQEGEVIQVKVPLPFALRWVNSYLVKGGKGYTLIDPGLGTEEAKSGWTDTLSRLGIRFADIEQIVLTHYHPDHYGLAGWFQQQSGAPVLMSETGHNYAQRLWGEGQTMSRQLHALYVRHGMVSPQIDEILPHMDSFLPLVSPLPHVQFIVPGQAVRLGDRQYVSIETPGHAAGHLCFYDEERCIMFCGDQVLPHISPNVSLLPGGDADPLQQFLTSLRSLTAAYPVNWAYPGHRDPFAGFAERIAQLLRHHEERLKAMYDLLSTPSTAYEVCLASFGSKLTTHQLRFAMSETLAHLVHLEHQGLAEQVEHGDTIYFERH